MFGAFAIAVVTWFAFTLFLWIPTHLVGEQDCLDNGYPEVKTTIFLDNFCVGLDGVVNTEVIKL